MPLESIIQRLSKKIGVSQPLKGFLHRRQAGKAIPVDGGMCNCGVTLANGDTIALCERCWANEVSSQLLIESSDDLRAYELLG